jgi:hypothetical protein
MAFLLKLRDVLGCKFEDNVAYLPGTLDGPTYNNKKLIDRIQTCVLMQWFPKIMFLQNDHTRIRSSKFLKDYAIQYKYDSKTKIGWLYHTNQDSLEYSCKILAEYEKCKIDPTFILDALWILALYHLDCEMDPTNRIGNLEFAYREYGVNARVFMQVMSSYKEPTMKNVCNVAIELSR